MSAAATPGAPSRAGARAGHGSSPGPGAHGAASRPAAAPDAWPRSYGPEAMPRMGFFTDTSVCIGCKACEVACKEWNLVPEDGLRWSGESYDNTGSLDANTWRHVAFIEQRKPLMLHGETAGLAQGTGPGATAGPAAHAAAPGATALDSPGAWLAPGPHPAPPLAAEPLRWLMSSDVCKHCTEAACLDVCPTGALFRTEFATVVVQEDICNGCGYCVPACPFGVLDKRHLPRRPEDAPLALPLLGSKQDGRVWKCTLCYDRLKGGHEPACAKACPTDSIQFGPLDELRERAAARLAKLQAEQWNGARLYGEDPDDGVGGFGAFFLLLDEPEVYGLPPDPVVCTRELGVIWRSAGIAALLAALAAVLAVLAGRRR